MRKLAIVIGHEAKAKGAKATIPIDAYEYDYNTEVAQAMYRYAKNYGIECKVFTRDGVGIRGAYNLVNEWAQGHNACCIELHFNSFDGKARGTETLCDDDPSESIEFAREIQNAMCSLFKREGKQNRGIKMNNGRGDANLDACKIPSCITEPFFGDNPLDAKLGHVYKFEYAKVLVDTAVRFLIKQEPDHRIG